MPVEDPHLNSLHLFRVHKKFSQFFFRFTLFNDNPEEAAANQSIVERVWGKTPIYNHLKLFEVALNTDFHSILIRHNSLLKFFVRISFKI